MLSTAAAFSASRPTRASWRRPGRISTVLGMLAACGGGLGACARAPADPEARAEYQLTNDPAEPTNRKIFAANQFVDRNAIRPVARSYQSYVPAPVRGSLHNFVSNLGQPAVAVNDVLQGSFRRAWTTTQRFAINTTVGGLGLFDVASGWNRPGHSADFGQTMGVWGVGPGPAVQLPLFGPSNVRDSVGTVVGLVTNPTTFIPGGAVVGVSSAGVGVVDGRANLLGATDSIEKTSLDYYATLRSLQAQKRAAFVAEGKAGGPPPASGTPITATTPTATILKASTSAAAN